jgi:hypothetical protein
MHTTAENLPAGFAAGYELDDRTGLWLPRDLCRPAGFYMIDDCFSIDISALDALPSFDAIGKVLCDKLNAKAIEQLFNDPGPWPGLTSATVSNFTSTNSASKPLTAASLYDLLKKFPKPPAPFNPTYIINDDFAQPLMPDADYKQFWKMYALVDSLPPVKMPPYLTLTAPDLLGPRRKDDRPFDRGPTKSRATIINEQDVLRAIHGDEAEYVWSEFLRAHMRIAEDLKLKRRPRGDRPL